MSRREKVVYVHLEVLYMIADDDIAAVENVEA